MPHPNPALVIETIGGYQRSAAINTAVEFDLFTAISEGATTSAALAAKLHVSKRGVRILADYLVCIGLLLKEDDAYRLTPEAAAFLVRSSPSYLGGTVRFQLSEAMRDAYDGLTDAVRKGGTALEGKGTMEPDHPVWIEYAYAVAPTRAIAAMDLAEIIAVDDRPVRRVLDVSAGHGMFGIMMAQRFPDATVDALDYPGVLQVAAEHAKKFEVEKRINLMPGSVFDVELPVGYDVILVPNFLHHFDVPTTTALATRFHHCLSDGGRMATLEFAPNADRVTPPNMGMFALVMLATTEHGDAYTVEEYEDMFSVAGFRKSEVHQMVRAPQRLIVSYK